MVERAVVVPVRKGSPAVRSGRNGRDREGNGGHCNAPPIKPCCRAVVLNPPNAVTP